MYSPQWKVIFVYNVQACAVMKCYRPNILIIKQKKESGNDRSYLDIICSEADLLA